MSPKQHDPLHGRSGSGLDDLSLAAGSGAINTEASAVKQAGWRDQIKVHPAADLFPMMSWDELEELARDISEHGLRNGIVFWTPHAQEKKLPQEIYLIDGRNRLAAIDIAFENEDEHDEYFKNAVYIDPHEEGAATLLYRDTDPYAYVVSTNIRRRHLTAEQKRDIIAELVRQNSERSDRLTAKIAGVDHKTVAAVRAEAEARGEIPHVDSRTDAVGRQQPAHKPASTGTKSRPAAGSQPASQARDKAVAGFSALLRQHPAATLDDLMRMLRGEGGRLREIPMPKRVVVAHAFLDALGIGADDLGNGGAS